MFVVTGFIEEKRFRTVGDMFERVEYWLKNQPIQNFGDSLSRVFMDRLFLPVGSEAGAVHLCGSVIDNMFVDAARAIHPKTTPIFWGCGIRTRGGLSTSNREQIKVLAVRGPISASELGLAGQIAIGDSALVLPVIYRPRSASFFENKSICIPHFHDNRSDDDLLNISGCDAVVRPNVSADLDDLYRLIDIIAASGFVLSASLHGAIVAAAYERPFGFWKAEAQPDLPLKWEDFAASANFPAIFRSSISEARRIYPEIESKIKLPSLSPLIENAPYLVRPGYHALFRAYDDARPQRKNHHIVSSERTPTVLTNNLIGKLTDDLHPAKKAVAGLAKQLSEALLPDSEREGADAHLLKRTTEQYNEIIALLNNPHRFQKRPFQKLKFRWQSRRYRRIIERSGLFDEAWYRKTYSDIGDRPLNALRHYVNHGRFEQRNPNPYFDTIWYLWNYPHVLIAGTDPLVHYIRRGAKEERDPGPNFNTRAYLAAHPEIVGTKINPLFHFLSQGAEGDTVGGSSDSNSAPTIKSAKSTLGSNGNQSTVVIIDVIYPTPDKDSGSIDTANFINVFLELGYRVVFIADAHFHSSSADKGWIAETAAEIIDCSSYESVDDYIVKEGAGVDVFMLSRVHAGGRYLEQIFHHSQAKVIFNTVDLHFLRERRGAELANDPVAINLAEATYERELHLCRMADATIVVSEIEGALLRDLVFGANIAVIPLARSAPGSKTSPQERKDVGFIGGFAHSPNVDAVSWFMEEIWPLVREREPALQFYIYGSNMPAAFAQYATQGVVAVGYIDTVDVAMDARRVMVAPLRYGAGAKGKVVSSLAHGVPCVATSIAVEGMGLAVGEDILVADTPEEFADQIVSLCTDDGRWNSVSTSGFSFIERNYSYKGMLEKVKGLLSSLGVSVRSDRNGLGH